MEILLSLLQKVKKSDGFEDNVGMILIHNGVVRGWSRKREGKIEKLKVKVDQEKIKELEKEYSRRPGIFKVLIHANEGEFKPGDDLLYIIVAGDIRDNVKPVLSELLDKVKKEAVFKEEFFI